MRPVSLAISIVAAAVAFAIAAAIAHAATPVNVAAIESAFNLHVGSVYPLTTRTGQTLRVKYLGMRRERGGKIAVLLRPLP